jgi:predicted nucleic acid-binding protein
LIAYVDSSVLLRLALGQSDALAEWSSIGTGVGSALAEVECLRSLDRLRLAGRHSDEAIALRRQVVNRRLGSFQVAEVTSTDLARAAHPFPTMIRTLDAIHLATALLWKEQHEKDIVMATHDRALAVAAAAMGLHVIGAAA